MTAPAWFLISAALFLIGAYASIFIVTTHKALNAWIALLFGTGALVAILALLLTTTVRPQ